jgi:hypothetical protein
VRPSRSKRPRRIASPSQFIRAATACVREWIGLWMSHKSYSQSSLDCSLSGEAEACESCSNFECEREASHHDNGFHKNRTETPLGSKVGRLSWNPNSVGKIDISPGQFSYCPLSWCCIVPIAHSKDIGLSMMNKSLTPNHTLTFTAIMNCSACIPSSPPHIMCASHFQVNTQDVLRRADANCGDYDNCNSSSLVPFG